MSSAKIVFAAGFAVIVSGCASYDQTVVRKAVRCDEAMAQGTAFGPGAARAIAVNSVRNQAGDVRGFLLSQGVHRVRVVNRSVSCRPYALGGGLVLCTAVTRFCGRW